MDDEPIQVRNNREASRYECNVDEHTAVVEYALEQEGRIILIHTEVPQALEGRGIAGQMVKAALADARNQKLGLVAQCPYAARQSPGVHRPHRCLT